MKVRLKHQREHVNTPSVKDTTVCAELGGEKYALRVHSLMTALTVCQSSLLVSVHLQSRHTVTMVKGFKCLLCDVSVLTVDRSETRQLLSPERCVYHSGMDPFVQIYFFQLHHILW